MSESVTPRPARWRRRVVPGISVIALLAGFLALQPTPTRPATRPTSHPVARPLRPPSAADFARLDIARAAAVSPMRGRIVALAESQVGYKTSPANTYCNKFSAYWVSGISDCGNSNVDEEWCADFAAWAWQKAGVKLLYQYSHGDLNSSAASFYEWGVAHRRWHAVGSHYAPRPGDVAVYGLSTATLFAAHVAIVIAFSKGKRGPDAVNGDGDRTGFSVVEIGLDEYKADLNASIAYLLAGYVSPT